MLRASFYPWSDSFNLPLDKRLGSPFDPPLDVENARCRSTIKVFFFYTSNQFNWIFKMHYHQALRQKSTTLVPCRKAKSNAQPLREHQPEHRLLFQSSTLSLFPCQCPYATFQQRLNMGKAFRWWAKRRPCSFSMANLCDCNKMKQMSVDRGNFLFNLRHEWFHVMLDVLAIECAVQTTLEVWHNLLLIRIITDQLLMVGRWDIRLPMIQKIVGKRKKKR